MEVVFEVLFEFIGEFVLQILFELLAAFGLRALGAPFQRDVSPWLAAPGYALFGAIGGGLSLLVVPALFIASPLLRLVNLVVAPMVAGGAMALLGAWRARHGRRTIRLDRFLYGVLFALAMALVRFAVAH